MTKNQPGTDVTQQFLEKFEPEMTESFKAAGLSPSSLQKISHDPSLYDTRRPDLFGMPDRHNATTVVLKPKVKFTCLPCKNTWTSAKG